jgi:riboflavin kinase / FMN adenylyltransferase
MSFADHHLNSNEITVAPGSSITLGSFDGCHLGHRRLLDSVDYALTFTPSPKLYFSKHTHLLNLDHEKRFLYDQFIFLRFDAELAQLSAEKFWTEIILPMRPSKIVVGWDFHFGQNLSGSTETLKKFAQSSGIDCYVVSVITMNDEPIKSTTIKEYISKGFVEKANQMLAYDYFYLSKVVRGKGYGADLGYPTINIELDVTKLLPKNGVYVGEAVIENETYKAAISIGKNLTMNSQDSPISLEAHLLDVDKDLYGKAVRLTFIRRIRDSKHFPSTQDLKAQIKEDVHFVRDYFIART